MKKLYILTMVLIFSCVIVNIYQLMHPHHRSTAYKVLNTITPVITLIYLVSIIKRKRQLLKKINEQIHKIFSKN